MNDIHPAMKLFTIQHRIDILEAEIERKRDQLYLLRCEQLDQEEKDHNKETINTIITNTNI